MKWNEVTTTEISGRVLVVKDAMIMLSQNETSPEWPLISCEPGEYIFEINVPTPFHAHRARIRRKDSDPVLGKQIGTVEVDHAFVGFIDYESFMSAVNDDYEHYAEWTEATLDDELSLNFSGEIEFASTRLLYVKAGDGDGTYPCFELIEDGTVVGIECVFKT